MARNERKPMSVRLSDDVQKMVEKRVQNGEFDSNADFLRQSVDSFLHQERLFEKLETMQRNLMASQLDVVAEVTGMTPEEKSQSAEALNVRYQDEIFES
jgi:Arc/MetJ-type ribon-helix-helix transcriptional regulator